MFLGEGSAFKRQLQKLPPDLQARARERLKLFVADTTHPLLKNHKLHGAYEGFWSINISGDIRLIYKRLDENTIFLRAIGTHHQLFGS